MPNIFINRENDEEYDELTELQNEDSEMEFERTVDYDAYFKNVVMKMAEHYAVLLERFVGKRKNWREIREQMNRQIENFGGKASLIDSYWIKKHGKIPGYDIIYQQLKNNAIKNNGNVIKPKYDTNKIVKLRLPAS